MKKKNWLLGLLALLVLLVAASGVLLAADKTETVALWAYGSSADSLEQLIPAFNAIYPNIKVEVTKIGWNEMYPKILAAAAAGAGGPDLVSVGLGNGVFNFASKKGVLNDLTRDFKPYAKDFTAAAIAGVTFQGKVYAIPWDVGPLTMFYRSDLYAAAGVDANSIKTWDDFIAAGKKLTKGDQQYATFFPYTSYEMGNWYFEPLIWQAGGNIFDKKGNVIIDKDPMALAVLQKLKEMVDSGIGVNAVPWSPAWNSAIKTGKIATIFAGGWFSGLLKSIAPELEGKWRIAFPPTFKPGSTGNYGGSALIIPKPSAHKAAALKFALYALATKEGQLANFKNWGLFPAYIPCYSDSLFDQPDKYFGNQPIGRIMVNISKLAPGTYNMNEYSTTAIGSESAPVSQAVVATLMGKKDPKSALVQAAKEVKAAIGR